MTTVRLKAEQRAGGARLEGASGWWCVSLTSPSVHRDRTIPATPFQGRCPVCFIRWACRVSPLLCRQLRSPSPAPVEPSLPLPPRPSWLQTIIKNAQPNSAVFGDALLPGVLEGPGGMAAFDLTIHGAAKSVPSSARILTMQKFTDTDYYELDWYYEECSDGN